MKSTIAPLLLAAAALSLALAAGCPPANPPAGEGEGEGEGEGQPGEGEGEGEGEGQAGEGEGEGEGEGGGPNGCSVDADCNGGVDQACDTIFSSAGTKSCFTTCTTLGDPCTTITGASGDCENFDAQGVRPHICVQQAGDREPCGDAVNAACGDNTPDHEAVCVTLGDDPNTPQNEHDFSYCLVACSDTQACPAAGEECSNDIQFHLGADQTLFGACAPTSTAGDACGVDATGATLCTGTQSCTIENGNNAGTCQ